MKLELKSMDIENFKGIKQLHLDFSPAQTDISGANASGKSSIADAFSWCIWNKDSNGNAPGTDSFREKPLDDNGQEIHNLETMVSIHAMLDGKPFNLKRIQAENWVRKRGSEDSTYQGNVSRYFINDVEIKQTEFRARIATIVPEDVSRLVTILSAFNQVEWKKRRQMLLEMSGVDVDQILLQQDEYVPIAEFIYQNAVSVEDMRKHFTAQRKNLENDLKMLPVRIDEATKAIPAQNGETVEALRAKQDDIKSQIADVDALILSKRSADQGEVLKSRLRSVYAEKERIYNSVLVGIQEAKTKAERKVSDLQVELKKLSYLVESTDARMSVILNQIGTSEELVERWRNEYKTEYTKAFSFDGDTVCPTCGQQLNEMIIAERTETAKQAFITAKNEALATLTTKGRLETENLKRLKNDYEKALAEHTQETQNKEDVALELETAKHQLMMIASSGDAESALVQNTEYQQLLVQIDELNKAINDSPSDILKNEISALGDQKNALNNRLFEIATKISELNTAEATKRRIAQLRKEMTEAGERINEVERMLILIEKFVQDRCGSLESHINNLFPTVRWKLFDMQINGGIAETCQCMIPCASGLVPYEGANTAARIAADVEIIDTLSRYYNAQLPIFLDNMERVNKIPTTTHQLITLTVTTEPGLTVKRM
jgi:DNA repair exonuclease SbcCD ATPase subunit